MFARRPVSAAPGLPVFAIRWASTTYSMNSVQFANAKTKPRGCPVTRIEVIVTTPAVVSTRAPALRQVLAPPAARSTVPRNSMAPTVDSGSRATAR
jgi:hypothetical protein